MYQTEDVSVNDHLGEVVHDHYGVQVHGFPILHPLRSQELYQIHVRRLNQEHRQNGVHQEPSFRPGICNCRALLVKTVTLTQ